MKNTIHQHCFDLLSRRKSSLKSELDNLKSSASADTKSSMGDKYETSREMINLEKGKIAGQLSTAEKMLIALKSIDPSIELVKGQLGALIETEDQYYFLSISLGKLEIDNLTIWAISPVSPVGRSLLDKQAGDHFQVGKKLVEILSVQ